MITKQDVEKALALVDQKTIDLNTAKKAKTELEQYTKEINEGVWQDGATLPETGTLSVSTADLIGLVIDEDYTAQLALTNPVVQESALVWMERMDTLIAEDTQALEEAQAAADKIQKEYDSEQSALDKICNAKTEIDMSGRQSGLNPMINVLVTVFWLLMIFLIIIWIFKAIAR